MFLTPLTEVDKIERLTGTGSLSNGIAWVCTQLKQ